MVSCCYLLGVRCFDVEVWSWWGNNVPVNLYKMNVIFSLDKKGHGSNAQLSPSKISGLAKRRQISVGSSFRTKFPHSAQLTPLREPGTQPSWPSISSGCPSGRPGLTDCGQGTWPLLFSRRDRDGGEVHRSSRLVEGLSEGPGALQDVASSSLGPLALTQAWVSWRALRRRPESASYLPLYLMTTTPLAVGQLHL